jgi:hypothetical protein
VINTSVPGSAGLLLLLLPPLLLLPFAAAC